jgi:hypothetical protein
MLYFLQFNDMRPGWQGTPARFAIAAVPVFHTIARLLSASISPARIPQRREYLVGVQGPASTRAPDNALDISSLMLESCR